LPRNKISICHICSVIFDSERKLRHHIDANHRMTGDMAVTTLEAEKIVQDILSTKYDDYDNEKILAISIINKNRGKTLAAKSRQSFKKAFGEVISEDDRYGRTLAIAIATLSVVNEVRDIFGEPQAIVTIHERCKLMLLPMPSYDIVVGLVVERSADVDDDRIANRIERLVVSTISLEKGL
jgi:hypothetical protein